MHPRQLMILVPFLVVASIVFYSQFSLNHDSSWYLIATRRFLDGAELYRDIVEINPPLAFYLTVPGLTLADTFDVSPANGFFIYVSVLAGLSTFWAGSVVIRSDLEQSAKSLLIVAVAICNFAFAVYDFGQREHLMMMFALPYLMLLICQDRLDKVTSAEAVAIGLVACLGLCLKPYFFLIPGGIIIAQFARSRDFVMLFGAANIAVAAGAIAYLLFIAIVHPIYLEEIVPTASLIYSAYGISIMGFVVRPELFGLLSVVVLAGYCHKKLDSISMGLIGAMAGALLSYLAQLKGWNYQIVPLSMFIFLLALWTVYRARNDLKTKVLIPALALSAIYFSWGTQISWGPYRSMTTVPFGQFVDEPKTPVLVLSSNLAVSFPFANEVDATWSSRYPAQWLIPGAVIKLSETDCREQPEQCARYQAILADTRRDIVSDFSKYRPRIVIIDTRAKKSYFGGMQFEYLPFLQRSSGFTEMWKDFEKIDVIESYEVWRRQSD